MRFKRKNKSKFRKGLLIYTIVLAVLIIAALAVLFDFMTVYEKSRPENYTESYIGQLDNDSVKGIMLPGYTSGVGSFEDPDHVYDSVFSEYFKTEGFKIRKKIGEYSDENPVYTVLSADDVQMFSITLEKNEDSLRYGFENWRVKKTEAIQGEIVAETGDYTVTVPENAEVYVNGVKLTGNELSKDKLIFRGISEFEKSTENSAKCTKYVVTGLFNVPEVKVLYNGNELTVSDEGGDYFADYPESDFISAEIKVPSGAEVKVNGINAEEKYITASESYSDLTPFESGDDFTFRTYRFTGLLSEPEISVSLDGKMLESDSGVYHFPEDMKKSITVTIPATAVLLLNGVQVSEEYGKTADGTYSVAEDFAKEIKNAPSLVTYTVPGLYNDPEMKVTENETELVLLRIPAELQSENGYEYAYICGNDAVKSAITTRADEFIRKYVYFASKGKENTAANSNAVVEYFFPGTPSAVMMYQARYSIGWNNAYNSLTYNSITIDNFVQISENCVSCDIAFNVTMERFGVERIYAEKFNAAFIQFNGTWYIGKLIMNVAE